MDSDKFTIFLTASGVLIGVLLVWAQLWASSYAERDDQSWMVRLAHAQKKERPWTVELGLVWTYVSVLLAMLSFAGGGYSYFTQGHNVPPAAMGLFIAAFLMTILNVAQSLISNLYKLVKKKVLANQLKDKVRWPIYVYVTTCGAEIILLSIWLGMDNLKLIYAWNLTTGIIGGLLVLPGLCLTLWLTHRTSK